MRTKQRLVRSLVQELVVDIDDEAREIVLVIHWRGGQHSELRVRKPESGEHTKRAAEDALAVIREMSTKCPTSRSPRRSIECDSLPDRATRGLAPVSPRAE